jgi:hypothetical protein
LFISTLHKVGWFIPALMPLTPAHIAHHILLSLEGVVGDITKVVAAALAGFLPVLQHLQLAQHTLLRLALAGRAQARLRLEQAVHLRYFQPSALSVAAAADIT